MDDPKQPSTPAPAGLRVRGLTFVVAAVVLTAVSFLAATGLARKLRQLPPVVSTAPVNENGKGRLFRGWPKPDLVLLLSAQQHGYMLPCGCSRPQLGGLERRYNLLELLKEKGWPVAAFDLGDVAQKEGPQKMPNVAGLIKYRYSMDALKLMNYSAVGLGEYEGALTLFETLGNWALNNDSPRVLAANLSERDTKFPGQLAATQMVDPKTIPGVGFTVGAASVIGPDVTATIKEPGVKFTDNRTALPQTVKELDGKKADLRVLLYQGLPKEARACAAAFPQFQVVLALCESDEPPSESDTIGNTLLATIGHKGKHVGVVGVYKTGNPKKPFELRYQLVTLGEEFMTPEAERARHPVVELMERYTKELKADNYLAKVGQSKHPLQLEVSGVTPTYVGSKKCEQCHQSAYNVWEHSKHAKAYQTLVEVKMPSLRQYDPECIICHTTGYGHVSGFENLEKTPKLINVGCESCHGPASEHVRETNNLQWRKLLNPWKAPANETPAQKSKRIGTIDQMCQKCHDQDNDVHYKFEKRWPDVDHPTPKE
jgi:hypothetical protein